jgi:hypothetical protein
VPKPHYAAPERHFWELVGMLLAWYNTDVAKGGCLHRLSVLYLRYGNLLAGLRLSARTVLQEWGALTEDPTYADYCKEVTDFAQRWGLKSLWGPPVIHQALRDSHRRGYPWAVFPCFPSETNEVARGQSQRPRLRPPYLDVMWSRPPEAAISIEGKELRWDAHLMPWGEFEQQMSSRHRSEARRQRDEYLQRTRPTYDLTPVEGSDWWRVSVSGSEREHHYETVGYSEGEHIRWVYLRIGKKLSWPKLVAEVDRHKKKEMNRDTKTVRDAVNRLTALLGIEGPELRRGRPPKS